MSSPNTFQQSDVSRKLQDICNSVSFKSCCVKGRHRTMEATFEVPMLHILPKQRQVITRTVRCGVRVLLPHSNDCSLYFFGPLLQLLAFTLHTCARLPPINKSKLPAAPQNSQNKNHELGSALSEPAATPGRGEWGGL